jgi:hypothetical protein
VLQTARAANASQGAHRDSVARFAGEDVDATPS